LVGSAVAIGVAAGVEKAEEDGLGEGFVAWVFECGHGLSLMFRRGLSLSIADFSAA
jgi:hypothetical protein